MTIPPQTPPPELPPGALALLARLSQYGVQLVVVGELAAAAHGLPCSDGPVAVVPARFGRNLTRLSDALRGLRARPLPTGEVPDPPSDLSAAGLRALGRWRLATQLGELEIDFEPPATAGHLDLFDDARRMTLTPGVELEVAALEDLVRIAEMRRSPADEAALPALRSALARRGSLSPPS